MKVTFVKQAQTAKNIFTFYFEPERPVRYTAGQFTEMYLPHDDKDDRGDKRFFTLSSAPSEKLLSITTKFAEKSSSFKKTLKDLEPGTQLNLASPMGDFVLPKDTSIPLLFVAGGIGCTPFHSIINELVLTGQKRDIRMIYGAHDPSEVAFKETFKSLGDKLEIETERLTADKILAQPGLTDEHYIYLSGPEPMVETLWKDLKSKGFNKKHIYTDFFPGYTY